MEPKEKGGRLSRRVFLKGVPLGVVGAVGLGLLSRRLWPSSARRTRDTVLFEDSIFSPAKDRDRTA